MVRQFYLAARLEGQQHLAGPHGGIMSIATEILSLRRDQSSSVERLVAVFDWERAAEDDKHILSRGYAVTEAADIVLLNVAVHAADALSEPPTIRRSRRGPLRSRRARRRPKTPKLRERRWSALGRK